MHFIDISSIAVHLKSHSLPKSKFQKNFSESFFFILLLFFLYDLLTKWKRWKFLKYFIFLDEIFYFRWKHFVLNLFDVIRISV